MEQYFTKEQLDTLSCALRAYQRETEKELDMELLSLDISYRTITVTEQQEAYRIQFRKDKDFNITLLEERNKEILLLRCIIEKSLINNS